MTDKLFVYGTLRRDVPGSRSSLLGPGADFVGHARMAGRLVDLGSFPGFVSVGDDPSGHPESDHPAWVHGELYTLRNPARILPRLDRYEGCGADDPEPHLFERMVGTAVRRAGTQGDERHSIHVQESQGRNVEGGRNPETEGAWVIEEAWVYVYRGPTAEGAEIPSGDYAVYRG